jgi:hypothetical protein
MRTHIGLVLLLALAGCEKAPKFTPAMMPPAASPLVLGTSTEADVLAKVASLPKDTLEVSKDKSLGGDKMVAFNDHPSIYIKHPDFGEAWLWDIGGTPKLGKLTLVKSEGCPWLLEHIANLDGSRKCPGNRKTGGNADGGNWCASLDGHTVHLECGRSMIDYWLGK